MSDSMDVIILKHKLDALINMVDDIQKCWASNENLAKAVPHLTKACDCIVKEIIKYQKKIKAEKKKYG